MPSTWTVLKEAARKTLNNTLKWGLVIISLYFVVRELFIKRDFNEFVSKASQLVSDQIPLLLLVCFLCFVNWGLETLKWQYLMKKYHPMSFFKAFLAVLSGISLSFFTPNRIGEFAGRVFHLPPQNRMHGISSTLIGSISQLAVTLIVGFIALAGHIPYLSGDKFLDIHPLWFILAAAVLILLFLFTSRLFAITSRIKMPDAVNKVLTAAGNYNRTELLTALFISLVRYSVYCIQFGIILHIVIGFPAPTTALFVMTLIPSYFLLYSIVPTIGVSDIGVSGYVLTVLFAEGTDSGLLILGGTLLWTINVLTPAIAGSFLLLRTNILSRQ